MKIDTICNSLLETFIQDIIWSIGIPAGYVLPTEDCHL